MMGEFVTESETWNVKMDHYNIIIIIKTFERRNRLEEHFDWKRKQFL